MLVGKSLREGEGLGAGAALCVLAITGLCWAGIDPGRVLVLVNVEDPSSQNAVSAYRGRYPSIPDDNVVYLSGLGEMTSSADEVISRADYESLIAEPVRQHLLDYNLVDHIWVIVTTAGMPYRIADTTYGDVVYPHGSNANTVLTVMDTTGQIDAACVESELAMLWQLDPALDPNHRAPTTARIVNPYHGYISPMSEAAVGRDILARRETFNFKMPVFSEMWVYEGQQFDLRRATGGRQFAAKDLYLVSRLDGPRGEGLTPGFYIRRMLEMSARVSDPCSPNFHGYDPAWTGVIIDDKRSGTNYDNNMWFNAGRTFELSAPPEEYLTVAEYPTPPNINNSGLMRDDYRFAFRSLVGCDDLPETDDDDDEPLVDLMGAGRIGGPVVYDASDTALTADLDPNYGIGALCTFGIHQGGGMPPTYLLTGGPNGGPLFRPVYGAIFNSTESFNAVTFFVDADIPPWAQQALIWQWFFIGGSGAVGYVFEPMTGSVVDNDLFFYNYFKDADGDGVGDMTFVEAAYTAMPCLSWATVVVGDPLMHVRANLGAGPGWMEPSPCGAGVPAGLMIVTFVLGLRWCCGRGGMPRDDA